jgi:uncharacterized protein
MKQNRALIIFARNPILGRLKTRLEVALGKEKTLEVYLELLDIVFKYTKDLSSKKIIYWDGGIPTNTIFTNKKYIHKDQVIGDLGFKMQSAFEEEFKTSNSICIIGSDCFELNPEILNSAFELLQHTDIVIGPALDGGYYLLGMKQFYPSLFQEVHWSTEKVFSQTIKQIINLSLDFKTLPILRDLDTIDDYRVMEKQKLMD